MTTYTSTKPSCSWVVCRAIDNAVIARYRYRGDAETHANSLNKLAGKGFNCMFDPYDNQLGEGLKF